MLKLKQCMQNVQIAIEQNGMKIIYLNWYCMIVWEWQCHQIEYYFLYCDAVGYDQICSLFLGRQVEGLLWTVKDRE